MECLIENGPDTGFTGIRIPAIGVRLSRAASHGA